VDLLVERAGDDLVVLDEACDRARGSELHLQCDLPCPRRKRTPEN
jgi:hypothetical protein